MFSCNVYSVPAINIVSSAFSLADCTLEKKLSTLGLVSAGSNGIAPLAGFCGQEGDNLCTMFHSVCCLFHAQSCCLSDGEKSSVLLTI